MSHIYIQMSFLHPMIRRSSSSGESCDQQVSPLTQRLNPHKPRAVRITFIISFRGDRPLWIDEQCALCTLQTKMVLWVHHEDLDEGRPSTKTLSLWTVLKVSQAEPQRTCDQASAELHSTHTEIPFSCPCLGGIPGKPFPYAALQLIPVQYRSFCVCGSRIISNVNPSHADACSHRVAALFFYGVQPSKLNKNPTQN